MLIDLFVLPQDLLVVSLVVHEAIYTSPGSELAAAKGTWWGALNGVTYVVDHESQARTEDNSLHSAWFGSGAAKKRKALSLAIDYAQAA